MGLIRQRLTLRNPRHPERPPIEVNALVDTGALHLCLPAALAEELDLETLQSRRVVLANGEASVAPYAGPVVVSVLGRQCFAGAVVMGQEVLLGAVPLEDLDLWAAPAQHRLVPNPLSPDAPLSVALGFTS